MKKLLCMIAMGVIAISLLATPVLAKDGAEIHGEFGAVVDAENGRLLYDKNAHEKAYPASITKVLTAILVSEYMEESDEIYASEEAVKQDPSNQVFLLQEGETMTKRDAMLTMMILSSNDVSYAIAEKIAGSVEGFADMMNEKAREIGVTQTNFITPNGLHHPEHYTTAYDIALIGREALKYPDVIEAMSIQEATVKTNKREITISVRNKIKERNPNAIGGKTGYTNAARNTLLEILEKDGKTIVAVVMKTTLDAEYDDIETMANIGFERLTLVPLVEKGELVDTAEVGGKQVGLLAAEDVKIAKVGNEAIQPETEIKMAEGISSVKENQKAGEMIVKNNGEVVKTINLLSDRTIVTTSETSKEGKAASKKKEGSSLFFQLFIAILIPIGTYIVLNVISNVRRLKKLKRRQI